MYITAIFIHVVLELCKNKNMLQAGFACNNFIA